MKSMCCSVMMVLTMAAAAGAESKTAVTTAVEKGLKRIEMGAVNYTKNRKCFSCHHTAMALFNLTSAQSRGFSIHPAQIKHQVDFTLESFRSNREAIVQGQGIPGASTMAVYALLALNA